jgi:hypothetical protein
MTERLAASRDDSIRFAMMAYPDLIPARLDEVNSSIRASLRSRCDGSFSRHPDGRWVVGANFSVVGFFPAGVLENCIVPRARMGRIERLRD